MFEWTGWDWLQVIAAAVGFFVCVLFVTMYLYTAGKDAWNNPFGRFLLVRKSTLSLLFLFILFNRYKSGIVVGPDLWTGQDAFWAILLSVFAAETVIPYRLMVSAQARQKKEAP